MDATAHLSINGNPAQGYHCESSLKFPRRAQKLKRHTHDNRMIQRSFSINVTPYTAAATSLRYMLHHLSIPKLFSQQTKYPIIMPVTMQKIVFPKRAFLLKSGFKQCSA